MYKLKSNEVR